MAKGKNRERKEVVVDRIQKEPWHLSKSVPLSLIMAIMVQTVVVAGAWFSHKAEFEHFRETTAVSLAKLSATLDDRYRKSQAASDFALRDERIQTLRENLIALRTGVEALDKSLDDKFEQLSSLIRSERRLTHPEDTRLGQ